MAFYMHNVYICISCLSLCMAEGKVGKKWRFWIILILLFLVVLFSGVFYFNLIMSGIGLGHIVFEGSSVDESLGDSGGQDAANPGGEDDLSKELGGGGSNG